MINRNGHRPGRLAIPAADRYRPGPWRPANRPSRIADEDDSRPLTALLHGHLFAVGPDGKVPAESLVAAWTKKAIDGDFKSLQEILIRIDGAAKSRPESAETEDAPVLPDITQRQANKILDAYYDESDDLPGD